MRQPAVSDSTVQEVLGRPAHRYQQWVAENVALFTAPAVIGGAA